MASLCMLICAYYDVHESFLFEFLVRTQNLFLDTWNFIHDYSTEEFPKMLMDFIPKMPWNIFYNTTKDFHDSTIKKVFLWRASQENNNWQFVCLLLQIPYSPAVCWINITLDNFSRIKFT